MSNNHRDNTTEFGGDKKVGTSLLSRPENKLKGWVVPKIPPSIETYHLTMATLLWSVINVVVAMYARNNLSLLWVVSLMIFLQYLTDLLDGELGRQRDTGLVKWGFYMDHFLDFVFLCSLVFVGFMISPAGIEAWYFALLVILGSFMVNSFLSFGATNEFEIYHYGVGPTEMRVVFILINLFIIKFGTTHFALLVPITVGICLMGLVIHSYQIHRKLWDYDMQAKRSLS
ncbi:MAG: CDP-alcohol phosphatidyltransferase family protein [Desulfobulbaceae bacterium]|nr:CDP-alcohol phosphatidyltransferase family protein [Desulfobulbaceae bacterium]